MNYKVFADLQMVYSGESFWAAVFVYISHVRAGKKMISFERYVREPSTKR